MRVETLVLEIENGGAIEVKQYAEPFYSPWGADLGKPVLCSCIDDGVKQLLSDGKGVYHLFSGGVLAYVGITNNFRRRLFEHMKTDKLFDAFLFFETETHSIKHLEKIERRMIETYNPILNLR
jgi:hypothetical protein